MAKRILGPVLVSVFIGAAVLLTLSGGRSRESLLPALRAVQEHEKQAERLVGAALPLSPEEERRIGAEFDARLARPASGPDHAGEARVEEGLVRELGRALAAGPMVSRFRRRYEFRVLHGAPGVNAFAVPGGYIYVLDGLARRFRRHPAALSAVLAHEIGHVELGHCADSVRVKEWLKAAGLEPLGGLSSVLRALAELHFSETQELEADAYSARLLAAAGQDPEAALLAMDLLGLTEARDAATRRGPGEIALEGLADYFRTHPGSWERRSRLRRAIARAQTERRRSRR